MSKIAGRISSSPARTTTGRRHTGTTARGIGHRQRDPGEPSGRQRAVEHATRRPQRPQPPRRARPGGPAMPAPALLDKLARRHQRHSPQGQAAGRDDPGAHGAGAAQRPHDLAGRCGPRRDRTGRGGGRLRPSGAPGDRIAGRSADTRRVFRRPRRALKPEQHQARHNEQHDTAGLQRPTATARPAPPGPSGSSEAQGSPAGAIRWSGPWASAAGKSTAGPHPLVGYLIWAALFGALSPGEGGPGRPSAPCRAAGHGPGAAVTSDPGGDLPASAAGPALLRSRQPRR